MDTGNVAEEDDVEKAINWAGRMARIKSITSREGHGQPAVDDACMNG